MWLIRVHVCFAVEHGSLTPPVHVNELKIRNESESQGGSLTDSVEDLLKGMWKCSPHTVALYPHFAQTCKVLLEESGPGAVVNTWVGVQGRLLCRQLDT